jgi:hypothetical protein
MEVVGRAFVKEVSQGREVMGVGDVGVEQGWPSSLIVRAIFQNLKFFTSCN